MIIKTYHTVRTLQTYHTVRTLQTYHTVRTLQTYHTVRTLQTYHTVRTLQTSNRKIVVRGQIDTSEALPLIDMFMTAHFYALVQAF
jgi:hypothetical protein